jgi:hypothetical protein
MGGIRNIFDIQPIIRYLKLFGVRHSKSFDDQYSLFEGHRIAVFEVYYLKFPGWNSLCKDLVVFFPTVSLWKWLAWLQAENQATTKMMKFGSFTLMHAKVQMVFFCLSFFFLAFFQ